MFSNGILPTEEAVDGLQGKLQSSEETSEVLPRHIYIHELGVAIQNLSAKT